MVIPLVSQIIIADKTRDLKKLIVPNSAVYWIIYNRNLITGAEEYI